MCLAARIAAEIAASKNAVDTMVAAMDQAGYVANVRDFEAVKEQADRWVFVALDDCLGDGYVVGAFYKATATKAADYADQPIGDFVTLFEALSAFDKA